MQRMYSIDINLYFLFEHLHTYQSHCVIDIMYYILVAYDGNMPAGRLMLVPYSHRLIPSLAQRGNFRPVLT